MRGRAAKLVLVVVSSGVALLAAEGVWRLAFPPPGFRPHSELGTPGLIVPHPHRSYALAPNFSGRMTTKEFDVAVRTDELGCRIPTSAGLDATACSPLMFDESLESWWIPMAHGETLKPFTILGLGDSFAFGHGLPAEAGWPEQLGRHLEARMGPLGHIRIVNGGISAYNMAQVRDLAEELAPKVAPDLIVLGLFVNGAERMKNPYALFEGDVVRAKNRSRLRAVPGGFLTTYMNRPRLQSLDFWLDEHLYVGAALLQGTHRGLSWATGSTGRFWRWLRRNGGDGSTGPSKTGERQYLAPLLDEVGKVDSLARSLHARLIVLVINVQQEDGGFREIDHRFERITAEYCAANDIAIFDPTPLLEERARGAPVFRYSRQDAHWSAAAHALVAERLAAFLERENLTPIGCAARVPQGAALATPER